MSIKLKKAAQSLKHRTSDVNCVIEWLVGSTSQFNHTTLLAAWPRGVKAPFLRRPCDHDRMIYV